MSNYSSQAIEVLTGLDPIRKRPGMYTTTENPNHLAQEVLDNGVDEALAGYASELKLMIYEDGSLSVADNGRGMPTDVHATYKISAVELIFTKLHSGAKFNRDNYAFSGGLHGVGVCVVNALSSRVQVLVQRPQEPRCFFTFVDGQLMSTEPFVETVALKQGTYVRFWPQVDYFQSPTWDMSTLREVLQAKAMLCPGLAIFLYDKRDKRKDSWCYQRGMQDYLQQWLAKANVEVIQQLSEQFIDDFGETIEWSMAWVSASSQLQQSYVNLIPTPLGGTHWLGFRQGVFEAVREFMAIHDLLPKGVKLKVEDACASLCLLLSLKIRDPQFQGQTKEKLSNPRVQSWVQSAVKNKLILWLNQHIEAAKDIVEGIIEQAKQRQRQRMQVERKQVVSGPALPGKLVDCTLRERQQTELFLVEGDSAMGTVRKARNRQTQAILPLRGKILNAWEVEAQVALQSQEIRDISVAVGLQPGDHHLDNLRYGKICILADADSDGNHIGALLCALFYRHYPALVRAGHLYVAVPPLFRLDCSKDIYYAANEREKEQIMAKLKPKKVDVMRFKGLGEMSAEHLRETAMAPASRRLVQLTTDDIPAIEQMLDTLLSKKAIQARKEWLGTYGDQFDQGL